MPYVKQTWNTGDIITAEKLNHIEDGLEELLNPQKTILLEETTFTARKRVDFFVADIPYLEMSHRNVVVVYDGAEYSCTREFDEEEGYYYGAPFDYDSELYDFSEYPFSILTYSESDTGITVAEEGEHTVEVYTYESSDEPTTVGPN